MLGKTENRRKRGIQRRRQLDGITVQWTWLGKIPGDGEGKGKPDMRQSVGLQTVGSD